MTHGEALLRGVCPQRIKQLLAIGYTHSHDVAVRSTAEEQRLASCFWISAHERVARPYRLAHVAYLLVSLAQKSGTITRGIMNRDLALDRLLERRRQGLISCEHIGKVG